MPGEGEGVDAHGVDVDRHDTRGLGGVDDEPDPALAAEVGRMQAALDCMSFAVQQAQEGYGHAVYQSRSFAAGDPVLLCLGDHLFRGKISCHRRLMQAYDRCGGRSVSAVNRIGPGELKGYGTIAGHRRQEAPDLIDVCAGTLDEPDLVTPTRHIWVESAISWARPSDTLPQHRRGPASPLMGSG